MAQALSLAYGATDFLLLCRLSCSLHSNGNHGELFSLFDWLAGWVGGFVLLGTSDM